MRKRKVTYPVPRTSRRAGPGGGGDLYNPPGLVVIDPKAREGRKGLDVGSRVRIAEGRLYGGESAVITALTQGVIPSAVIKTDAGRTRHVRTIDLELITGEEPKRE